MPDILHDLRLTGLAYGGEALGRIPAHDGKPERVVFVPFGIPGELVRIRIVEERKAFARGQLIEVLEPSPQRSAPRCKHFGVCGGCHYQHMPYELQLQAKTDILRDQFRRIGHIENPPVLEGVPSPEPWYYRNQIQVHLTEDGRLGYVAASVPLPAQAAQLPLPVSELPILPITECHLPEQAINGLWPELAFEPGTEIERVVVRQGNDEEIMVALQSDAPDLPELDMEAGISVVHLFEEHAVVMAGNEHIIMRVKGRDFRVSAGSFFQVNTAMAEKMVEHVLRGLPASPAVMLDVYCGVGLFSAFLAPV